MKINILPTLATLTVLTSQILAGPLKEAKINQIVNDVKVVEPRQGARPAALQEVIKNDLGVATGIQSRAELLFQDDTLTRLGAETFFSFQPGTRNLKLDRGAMLLQVPKNLGGARIRAASVSASITGTTIMVEHLPGNCVKIVVLEGSLRVAVDARPAESLLLEAGKMVTIKPDAKQLPPPVAVDLRKLVRTSALIDPVLFAGETKRAVAALPSMGLIEKEIARQEGAANAGTLVAASIDTPMTETDQTKLALLSGEPLATSQAKTEPPLPASDLTPALTTGSALAATGGTVTTTTTAPATTTPPTTVTPPPPVVTPPPVVVTPPLPTAAPVSMPASAIVAITPAFIYPVPSLAAVPAVPPASTTNLPPVTQAALSLNSAAAVRTWIPGPKISGVPGNPTGSVYAGAVADGSAGMFLYGTASTYDAQRNLDGRFGQNYEPTFASTGVAVFKFSSLLLDGAFTFKTSTQRLDAALIGVNGISNSLPAPRFTVDVSGLRSLFIGTENGPLSIGAASFAATPGSTFRFLQIYGRGTGSMSIDTTLSLPTANLFVDAPGALTFGSGSSVTVDKAVVNATGLINANGVITANTLQFNSETGVQMKKKIGTLGVLNVFAPTFMTTAPLAVTGGTLQIGAGGIDSNDLDLTGFDTINSQGSISTGNVLVHGDITTAGAIDLAAGAPHTITATNIRAAGGIANSGDAGFLLSPPKAGGTLTLDAAQVVFDTTGINGANFNGGDAGLSLSTTGGDGGTLNVGTAAKPIAGKVWVGAPITATTGANATAVLTGGNGGTVNIEAADSIAVSSTVKVSDSAYVNDAAGNPTSTTTGRGSAKGGNISLHSTKTTGTAINVQSTAQLLSLLSAAAPGPGGTIKFVSEGGDISVDNGNGTSGSTTSTGKIWADKGTVHIQNNGTNGRVMINNANIRGDVVKIGALGANGQLIVGGGTINADTSLKLYGGSSNGSVRFTDNVTLGGNSTKTIAGKTVTIDNGKVVTVGGTSAANVHTDNPNYTGSGGNGSQTGTFGGKGATTSSFSSRPAF